MIFTDTEVADMLHMPREAVQDQCRSGRWPHLRIGRRYRFTDDHLREIATKTEVRPSQKAAAAQSWGRKTRSAS